MNLRVAVIPADETGCGTYRMILPAHAVKLARPDWQIDLYKPGVVQLGTDKQGNLVGVKGLNDPDKIDLLVMQRVGSASSVKFVKWATDHGIAVSIDADDDLRRIDQRNYAYKSWNGGEFHWRYMDEAALHADLMTVTTEELARRYGKHGRTEVLPNYVPEQILDLGSLRDQLDETVTVGWTGFTVTHPGDLLVVGHAVRDAVEHLGIRARVIGDGGGAARDWGLAAPDIDGIAPIKFGPHFFAAMTAIDIGLVPLASSKFNKAKSSLKALEFSAMGVPVIASPTPANRALSKDVPIQLAATPAEWYKHIKQLAENPQARIEMGEWAREKVKAGWTVEGHGEDWAQAWERAVARRARMVA